MAVRVGGDTVIEDYTYINAMSNSWKYSMRGRDWQYRTRVQNANAMIERIKANLPSKLEIIDDVNMEYLICSQMIHEHWYPFNLGA